MSPLPLSVMAEPTVKPLMPNTPLLSDLSTASTVPVFTLLDGVSRPSVSVPVKPIICHALPVTVWSLAPRMPCCLAWCASACAAWLASSVSVTAHGAWDSSSSPV